MNQPFKRSRLFGCPVDAVGLDDILAAVRSAIMKGEGLTIEGINVSKVVDSRTDPLLRDALEAADINHADGAGAALGARLAGIALPPRVAGVDLMGEMLGLAEEIGAGVYFLGARPQVVDRLVQVVCRDHPRLVIAGWRDGYFSEAEEPSVAAHIAQSGARLLFIGIASPKKEAFVMRNAAAIGPVVTLGVGGSFDVHAGFIPRAPLWMQRCGLEWVFRLMCEPKRLFKRYAVSNTVFLMMLAHQLILGGQEK